jgi:2-dehydropantoate 2-reductase
MAVNGVPWWYFHGVDGPLRDPPAQERRSDGRQWDLIGPQRVIGLRHLPAAEISAPGEIRHIRNDRLSLGRADGANVGASPLFTALDHGRDSSRR